MYASNHIHSPQMPVLRPKSRQLIVSSLTPFDLLKTRASRSFPSLRTSFNAHLLYSFIFWYIKRTPLPPRHTESPLSLLLDDRLTLRYRFSLPIFLWKTETLKLLRIAKK